MRDARASLRHHRTLASRVERRRRRDADWYTPGHRFRGARRGQHRRRARTVRKVRRLPRFPSLAIPKFFFPVQIPRDPVASPRASSPSSETRARRLAHFTRRLRVRVSSGPRLTDRRSGGFVVQSAVSPNDVNDASSHRFRLFLHRKSRRSSLRRPSRRPRTNDRTRGLDWNPSRDRSVVAPFRCVPFPVPFRIERWMDAFHGSSLVHSRQTTVKKIYENRMTVARGSVASRIKTTIEP